MGKVVNINTYRHKKKHPGQMNYDATFEVKDKLEIAAAIIDELFLQAEECIRECGFNPADFTILEQTARDCLAADLNEFFASGEETLSLTYEAVIGGIRYAVVSDACADGDEVEFTTTFVKWDGDEWLEYADDSWHQGPGPDFI